MGERVEKEIEMVVVRKPRTPTKTIDSERSGSLLQLMMNTHWLRPTQTR